MGSEPGEFQDLVAAIVERYFRQNGTVPPPAEELRLLAVRLHQVFAERGLPRPLAEGERGEPGGLPEEICGPLVARVAGAAAPPLLREAARQLIKACFHPEFTVCRDSYRETGSDGGCRRQELARVRGRVSGSHCIDCPHWTARTADEHRALLAAAWRGAAGEWAAHADVFLPEDFRAFARWRHAAARGGFRMP